VSIHAARQLDGLDLDAGEAGSKQVALDPNRIGVVKARPRSSVRTFSSGIIGAETTKNRRFWRRRNVVMRQLSPGLVAFCFGLTGCNGAPATGRAPAPIPPQSLSRVSGLWGDTIPGQTGAAVYIYKMPVDGFTDPNHGGASPDAASFNTVVYGTSVPPQSYLTGFKSTFGGNPGTYVEMTDQTAHDQFKGTVILACDGGFEGPGDGGNCVAAKGSKTGSTVKVHEFTAVQAWPFYVGAGSSSNVAPGRFGFETISDDGSYLVLGPAPFTYAQPGNFQGATGLNAGTALVPNGGAHSPKGVSGSVQIAAQNCVQNLYWLTFEWYEIVGGRAGLEFDWTPPGTAGAQQVTQAVLWGLVTSRGVPVSGAAVSVGQVQGGPASLVTDANGCYGYNYLPFAKTATVSVMATVHSGNRTLQAQIMPGNVTRVDFTF